MDFLDRTEERERLTRLLDGRSGGRTPVHVLARLWRKVARWWGAGTNRQPMELDVVAESPDGETLLVGEAKLSLTKAEAVCVRAELKAKAALLPFAKDYKRVLTKLFVYERGYDDKDDEDSLGLVWGGALRVWRVRRNRGYGHERDRTAAVSVERQG